MERSYLDGLAAALKIAPEEKAALDSEAVSYTHLKWGFP